MTTTNPSSSLAHLKESYQSSPFPSFKVSNYFYTYDKLFSHLIGTECTFIEVGVLNGGSLFMWRNYLGEKARIIGIDLNPEATKWRDHGFEIVIGDQSDANFWTETFKKIGPFDVLLDDGGHQYSQQIVTLSCALKHAKENSVVVIEDICTSFFKLYASQRQHSFMEYAKGAADLLAVRGSQNIWPRETLHVENQDIMQLFQQVHSVEFFEGMVAFKINHNETKDKAELIWNHKPAKNAVDFNHTGTTKARVNWTNPFITKQVALIDWQNTFMGRLKRLVKTCLPNSVLDYIRRSLYKR